ncbi:MAG TPA: two-component regulator propeller domain-containing protein [bacterium]|nr:two-component regulator propeller domain-containing protein [bacterium]HQI47699.1 two-component regulator propeller domain-containing protein [bacterium]HQJ63471.1 two-component regulator propeller domain-containing protein [bacterium]
MKTPLMKTLVVMGCYAALNAQDMTWENFTSQQEARVLLDDNNYLWIGSSGGLLRFNKVNETTTQFTRFGDLSSHNVQCLYKDFTKNQLWVGTEQGLAVFDGTNWESIGINAAPIRSIRDIKGAGDGDVWITGGQVVGILDPFYAGPTYASYRNGNWLAAQFDEFSTHDNPIGLCLEMTPPIGFYCGTTQGLYYILPDSWLKTDISPKIMDLAYDDQSNSYWVGSDAGLYQICDGKIERKLGDGYSIAKIAFESTDKLWLIQRESTNRLIKYEKGIVSPLSIQGSVHDLLIDADKTLWIGTENGLYKKTGENLKSYSFASGLKSNRIRNIEAGQDGALYFTFVDGNWSYVGRFGSGTWSYSDVMPVTGMPNSLHVDLQNRIWAILNGSAYYNKGSAWMRFTSGNDNISSMSENSDGYLWFGGNNHVLCRVSADFQARQDFGDKISIYPTRSITAILEDETKNVVWMKLDESGGIIRLNLSDSSTAYWDRDHTIIPPSDVKAFRRHADGTIWAAFGTENQGGLYYFRDDEWTRAPIDKWGLAASYISDLEIDDLGRIWFTMYGFNSSGSYGGGLGMYDGVQWRQYKTSNSGLVNNYATGLAIDQNGKIWISTLGGISCLTLAQNAASVAQQPSTTPEAFQLGAAYPNPFNPSTTITFEIPQDGFVSIKIYNLAGRLVCTLMQEQKVAGRHSVQWNATDENGQRVAAGVYLYQTEFTDALGETMVLMRKMSLVK